VPATGAPGGGGAGRVVLGAVLNWPGPVIGAGEPIGPPVVEQPLKMATIMAKALSAGPVWPYRVDCFVNETIMWLIVLEALAALAIFVFLIWWTMFSGRKDAADTLHQLDAPPPAEGGAPGADDASRGGSTKLKG